VGLPRRFKTKHSGRKLSNNAHRARRKKPDCALTLYPDRKAGFTLVAYVFHGLRD
jgi:hypothetical protein